MSDEPAELVGHGPIEGDLLQDVLLAGPRLRVVWTDEHGVPVAVDDRVVQVPCGDPAALRQALLDLVKRPPPKRQPRAPDDHARPAPRDGEPAPPPAPAEDPERTGPTASPHPADQPGPYRPPRRSGPDIAGRWECLPLARRRGVIDLLLEISVLPVTRHGGYNVFDPESVRITWKTGD